MRSSRRFKWPQQFQCRLVSLITCLSLCATIFPLPIDWRPGNQKDLSSPFPCQHRACGCRSAEQCWKKCCCFSNSQKLAWAKEHRVDVPSYVMLAAKKEQNSKKLVCRLSGRGSHSDVKICSACQSRLSRLQIHKCCDSPDSVSVQTESSKPVSQLSASDESPELQPSNSDTQSGSYVLSVFWHQCQGQNWWWNSLPWAVVVEFREFNLSFPAVCAVCTLWGDRVPQWSLRPPIPPPRGC